MGPFLPLVPSTTAEGTELIQARHWLFMVTLLSGFDSGFLDVCVHIVAGLYPPEIIQNQCGSSGTLGNLVSPGQFKMKYCVLIHFTNKTLMFLAETTFFP